MWRKLRIAVLLVVLGVVATGAWLDRLRTTSWEHTVWVGAFPVNADGSAAAADYIAGLSADELQPARQAHALQRLLNQQGYEVTVACAMRYGNPSLESVLEALRRQGDVVRGVMG